MTEQQNLPSKVPPFVQREPPTKPGNNGKRNRVSQRGLLSVLMMILSVISLTVLMFAWLKITLDIFDQGLINAMEGMWAKGMTLALAFLFGWLAGVLSIRVFGNLILPSIIKSMSWIVLVGIGLLYIAIIQRLYIQQYDLQHFVAYLLMMAAGLVLLVGFHLILDDHDLRPYSIPLLIIAMFQLFIIVFRYVFDPGAEAYRLLYDFIFFAVMTTVSAMMLAHRGLLNPFRHTITKFFDRNSRTLRPEN